MRVEIVGLKATERLAVAQGVHRDEAVAMLERMPSAVYITAVAAAQVVGGVCAKIAWRGKRR